MDVLPSRHHMRRQDRAVTDASEVDSILRRGRFATIAFARADEPYLVTLSYGFEAGPDGTPVGGALYFHAAHEGLKHEFMVANPRVCATVVIDGGYVARACEHRYESVVLRGSIATLSLPDDLQHGMRVLTSHLESTEAASVIWARHELAGPKVYRRTAVLRLSIDDVTGKRGR